MEVKKINLENQTEDQNNSVSHPSPTKKIPPITLVIVLGVVLGSLTGFFLARPKMTSTLPTNSPTSPTTKEEIKVGQVFGSPDEKTFRDNAIGVLRKGGVDGEGSHHLVRPGGPSKNVYLTSSVVDLDLFEGAKVEVWGETFGAKKAGWLMDVGRVKVLDLNPSEPTE